MSNEFSGGTFAGMLKMPRYVPAWFSAFLFGLCLLFIGELPANAKAYMVPSLLVYSLGTVIFGTLHRLLGLHYVSSQDPNNEKPIPLGWKITLLLAHVAWFAAFIWYNVHRKVL